MLNLGIVLQEHHQNALYNYIRNNKFNKKKIVNSLS